MTVFDALADPVRRRILRILVDGPRRVVDLQRVLSEQRPLSRPAVSRHLRVLGEAGLVEATETGREHHYRLDTAPLAEVRDLLDELRATSVDLAARAPIQASMLDALDTEVRRTRRDRRRTAPPPPNARDTAADPTEETA